MKEIFSLNRVTLSYRKVPVIENIRGSIHENRLTCILGPSGAGKSTLLRSLNRMNDLLPAFHLDGQILFHGEDVYRDGMNVPLLRQRVGMVFQKPCIFPQTIFNNVIFGIRRLHPERKKTFPEIVEKTLRDACLWDEVRDRLHHPALELSQGQQQRLSIARALAVEPEVLLLDEPTSALDAQSSDAIHSLVVNLKSRLTLILVTHKVEQAKKLSDDVIWICNGRVCKSGESTEVLQDTSREGIVCHP